MSDMSIRGRSLGTWVRRERRREERRERELAWSFVLGAPTIWRTGTRSAKAPAIPLKCQSDILVDQ